ncbi:unnamed protein product [Cladocopium goreaui]|uniref:Elongation factor 1-beta n=1 Tax=Cladocopium goreaui TaxID=2562237 RepID=A0A9P1CCS7_9DINO|nr:unnamed protein product [Cladocopium goreaui]
MLRGKNLARAMSMTSFTALNAHFSRESYLHSTVSATQEDFILLGEVGQLPDRDQFPHLARWAKHIGNLAKLFPYRRWPAAVDVCGSEEDLGAVKVGPVSVDDSEESPVPPPKPDPIPAPTPLKEPEGDQPFKLVPLMKPSLTEGGVDTCIETVAKRKFKREWQELSRDSKAELAQRMAGHLMERPLQHAPDAANLP